MLKFFSLVLFSAALLAQPSLVTVRGQVKNPDGTGWNGTIEVSNPRLLCSGVPIPPSKLTYTVTAGTPSPEIKLYPLASCTPGYSYAVSYLSPSRGAQRGLASWNITTGTTTTIAAVETSGTPQAPVQFNWNQLTGTQPFQTPLTWLGSGVSGALDQIITPTAIGAEAIDPNIVRKDGSGNVSVAQALPLGDTNIAAWGDSLSEQNATGLSYPTQLATLLGDRYIYNGGISGQTSTQIMSRMTAATDKAGYITIIWVGRNNLAAPTTIKADIATMVAALSAPKRYLILADLNSAAEPSGSANYNLIIGCNSDLAALYPNNYLDIRAVLVAAYDPGTPLDVTYHSQDIPPSTLSYDGLHQNTAGNAVIAAAVAAWLNSHYLTAGPLATNQGALRKLLAAPYAIGSVTPAPGFFSAVRVVSPSPYGLPFYSIFKPSSSGFPSTLFAIQADDPENVWIGVGAGASNTTGTGTWNVAVGKSALALNSTGQFNTALGRWALTANTTASGNTAVGTGALAANVSGGNLTAIGLGALGANTTVSYHTAVGVNALSHNTTGIENAAVGYGALGANTTGSTNTAFGMSALTAAVADSGNTAIGHKSLFTNNGGGGNTGVGDSTLIANTTGADNTAIGNLALLTNTASNQSTAVGSQALQVSTGGVNTALGYQAGKEVTSGLWNVHLGAAAGMTTGSWNNTIAIGHSAKATAANTAVIGDANNTDAYFGSAAALAKVHAASGSQIMPTSTAPACAAAGDIGRIWIDSTIAATTAYKLCLYVANTPTWVTK